MKTIRPGLNIRVVAEMDPVKETISVRSSTIYEINDDRLVFAQTTPPITKPGHEVIVTYLANDNEDQRRGFSAEVMEIIGYELAGGQHVKALVAIKKGKTSPFSIRMAHRVKPTENAHLTLFINGVNVEILDISLKGAQFKYPKRLALETGGLVDISIDIGTRTYDFKDLIGRTWESNNFVMRKQNGFATVEFTALSKNAERALLHKLRQIEREHMKKPQSPDGGD